MNSLISLAIQTATTRSNWLHTLATERGISVVALCRELGTTRALAVEVAQYYVRKGEADAVSYIQAKESPPPLPEYPTLRQKVCAHVYAELRRMELEGLEEAADAELEKRKKTA